MKVRIAWPGVAGYALAGAGTFIGTALAPWPLNGLTLLAILLIALGGFLVGTVVTR